MTLATNIKGATKLIIEAINGDLRLRGRGDSDELYIECEELVFDFDETAGGPVRLSSNEDCEIKVPDHLAVEILTVNGDIDKIAGLNARLDIQTVNGDAVLRQHNGELVVQTIQGDIDIKNVEGNVALTQVSGDVQVKHISGGSVTIGRINGDLIVKHISQDCRIEHVSGDIAATIDFQPHATYLFNADGDIAFIVSEDTNATFIMPIDSDINILRQFDDFVSADESDDGNKIVIFGKGEAQVQVESANDIAFVGTSSGFNVDFDLNFDLGEQFRNIEATLNEKMKGFSKLIESKASEALAATAEAINATSEAMKGIQIETRMDTHRRRAERVQERASRARERAERATERASRRSERMQRFSSRQQNAPSEPVTHEERLMILKMVQDGKISVEEADKLLATLEGR